MCVHPSRQSCRLGLASLLYVPQSVDQNCWTRSFAILYVPEWVYPSSFECADSQPLSPG